MLKLKHSLSNLEFRNKLPVELSPICDKIQRNPIRVIEISLFAKCEAEPRHPHKSGGSTIKYESPTPAPGS
ncbi:hypothetical protein DTO006G1_2069 [Penicillium roqueforti]|nr:hypothetical protein CBS147372_7484 [Penicillium roqueforti]KAI2721099.1 hypothetical protein CBS147354_5781 [Penicillium roqueforti]KAI2762930.1 hypothetical protein DTO006G1_2069 [Penicillium roqueforti]KAI3113034.1 hypothetical protein CBS147333_3026 [Penicillium roqueforti]KAI3255833.1 hypothetical protein DTO006G7_3683 [Penicillium roqueforti]